MKAATQGVTAEEVFMTTLSPGSFANHNPNRYYPSREVYLIAVADVRKRRPDIIYSTVSCHADGGFRGGY